MTAAIDLAQRIAKLRTDWRDVNRIHAVDVTALALDMADALTSFAWAIIRLRHGNSHCDHACSECFPGGNMVVAEFRCAYHEARALVAPCACPDPGPHRGCQCRAAKGFRFTSDDWCDCKCHRAEAGK